jgi:hypothetical protein
MADCDEEPIMMFPSFDYKIIATSKFKITVKFDSWMVKNFALTLVPFYS